MTGREFFNRVMKGKRDFLQEFLDALRKNRVDFCVVGGLAVNAYSEPVVSLDLDVVVIADKLDKLISSLEKRYTVKRQSHSINIKDRSSDLRIQIQTDTRYQPFIDRAVVKNVLGYRVPVASVEDILRGKIWAVTDKSRRASKRQKDLADVVRLVEVDKKLLRYVPDSIKKMLFPEMEK